MVGHPPGHDLAQWGLSLSGERSLLSYVHATNDSWGRWVLASRLFDYESALTRSFAVSDSCAEGGREPVSSCDAVMARIRRDSRGTLMLFAGGGADFGLSIVHSVAVAYGRRVKPFRRLVQRPGGRGAARANRVGREHQ